MKVYVVVDVFVFLSCIDMFGFVLFEVFVCGMLVVVYFVMGLIDVFGEGNVGVMYEDL